MKLLEKILFATDLTQSAHDALRMAITVARTFGSQISVLHVMPDVQDSPLTPDIVKSAAVKQLQEVCDTIKKEDSKAGEMIVATGSPFDQIIQCAERLDVNVIMIGSGEMASESVVPLGNTADKLIRKASKPVWVVKKESEPRLEKILCPVDFSDTSRRALTNAIHLARNFGGELTVLTVIEPLSHIYQALVKVPAKLGATYKKDQKAKFEQFFGEFDFHNVKRKKVFCEGKPHQEILNAARVAESDLIVMGSQGRTGVSRMLLGSVAEKVVREMPCSVITVKSEHAIRLKLEAEIADAETHFKRGQALLAKGFPAESLREFEAVIAKDMMYAPAWEGLALAHGRLGEKEESKKCKEKAQYIRKKLWEKRVEAEVRARHTLWGKRPKKL